MNAMTQLAIKDGYLPGAIGRITELHSAYYWKQWGFGLYFESKVAVELSEFLSRFDKNKDGIWLATLNGRIEGSLIMDGIHAEDKGVHLRWFIVSGHMQGKGIGRLLISRAMDFYRIKQYHKIYLWSFEGLNAARHLYENAGFRLVRQKRGVQWGTEVNEQYFEHVAME